MSPLQSAVRLETEAKLDIALPKLKKIISCIRPHLGRRLPWLSWVTLETLPHLSCKPLSDLDCANVASQNSTVCYQVPWGGEWESCPYQTGYCCRVISEAALFERNASEIK